MKNYLNLLKKYAKYGALTIALFLFTLVGVACVPEDADTEGNSQNSKEQEQSVSVDEQPEEKQKSEKEPKQQKTEQTEEQNTASNQEKNEEQEETENEEQGNSSGANSNIYEQTEAPSEPANVPEGQEDVQVNNNVPYFSNEDISSTEVYHRNGSFDSLGRVTAANAVVGTEIMPAEERGSISHIEPTGWNQARYENIGSGGWLYNRSHLIGHQMTGNDEPQNIMTGTRWFNTRMLEYENFVANYVETTGNHVRYRVTPVFEGNNLLASGAYMEGFSIEDNGEGLMFNIYVPNVQPGVEINYTDGSSVGPEGPAEDGEVKNYNPEGSSDSSSGNEPSTSETVPETSTDASSTSGGDVSSVDTNGNGTVTIKEAEDAGYVMPITLDHWLYEYMNDSDGDGKVGE